jgi:hypothetical protein
MMHVDLPGSRETQGGLILAKAASRQNVLARPQRERWKVEGEGVVGKKWPVISKQ